MIKIDQIKSLNKREESLRYQLSCVREASQISFFDKSLKKFDNSDLILDQDLLKKVKEAIVDVIRKEISTIEEKYLTII